MSTQEPLSFEVTIEMSLMLERESARNPFVVPTKPQKPRPPTTLEQRLEHFIGWLEERGIMLWEVRVSASDTSLDTDGFNPPTAALVEEYVNG